MRVQGNRVALLLTAFPATGMVLLLTVTAAQGKEPEPLPVPAAMGAPALARISPSVDALEPIDEASRLGQELEAAVRQDLARRIAGADVEGGVGTVSNVQENGRRVEGLVSVGAIA